MGSQQTQKKETYHVRDTIGQDSSKGASDSGCGKEETGTDGLLLPNIPHTNDKHWARCKALF